MDAKSPDIDISKPYREKEGPIEPDEKYRIIPMAAREQVQ